MWLDRGPLVGLGCNQTGSVAASGGGEDPARDGVSQAAGDEVAQVECGGAAFEPGVVVGGAAVAQFEAATATVDPAPGFSHTLLIRRALTPKVTKAHPEGIYEVEYFLVHARVGTPIPRMITAAGLRWNIEDDNRVGKDLLGLDQYQVRKWTPWHRHVTTCMLAHAFLAVTRANLGKDQPGAQRQAAD